MSGRLFVVSGPSGAGKSSLCAALLQCRPELQLSVSCTTRKPRPGEIDGREYHFLTESDFITQREQGGFLEWANVHGHLYGTRQRDVESMMATGSDVLLEIDWQGARQVADRIPAAVRLFILPPSLQELRQRLTLRAQDSSDVVEQRVAAAQAEMDHAEEAHYRIVNRVFDDALAELVAVISDDKDCNL